MNKTITLKDIAKKAGVSTNTVSRALRDLPGVNSDTKKEILDIAKDLGYLVTKEQNQSAIVLSSFALSQTSFFGRIITSLTDLNPDHEVIEISPSHETLLVLPEQLIKNRYENVYIVSHFNSDLMRQIKNYQSRIILVDHQSNDFHTINSNNYEGGRKATQHLIDNKHKQIGFIGDISFSPNYKQRYLGFLDTIEANNLTVNNDFIIIDIKESQSKIFQALNNLDDMPTAWFCVNSGLAFMLNTYLISIGKTVPIDASIICYDDTEFTRTSVPRITNVSNDLKFFGILATLVMKNYNDLTERLDIRVIPTLKEEDSVSKFDDKSNK